MKQITANRIMLLYHEMNNFDPEKCEFDQNRCSACVIGNGIRAGVVNGFKQATPNNFWHAIAWIFEYEPDNAETGSLASYLFSTKNTIRWTARHLGGLPNACDTPEDACIRMAALLDKYEYDIK